MRTKDVFMCFTTESGEQCVMMDSPMQQQESFATLLDLGRHHHYMVLFSKTDLVLLVSGEWRILTCAESKLLNRLI